MQKALLPLIVALIVIGAGVVFLFSKDNKQEQNPGASQVEPATKIHEVSLTQRGFEPQSITINKGETVRWTNRTENAGSVNSASHPEHSLHKFLNLGEFPPGSAFQTVFEETGTYNYHNHFSPEQEGTVVVQ